MSKLQVKCPQCQKEFLYRSSEDRPFCSERCRMVDLGHWLDGSYGVPAQKITEEEQLELEAELARGDGDP